MANEVFKCHKIRGVEKSVCTAEEKIAYNFAFQWESVGKKILAADAPEFVKADAFHQITGKVAEACHKDEKLSKYNLDVIICAFRHGFKEFCKNPFIATSYEQIGKCFDFRYQAV